MAGTILNITREPLTRGRRQQLRSGEKRWLKHQFTERNKIAYKTLEYPSLFQNEPFVRAPSKEISHGWKPDSLLLSPVLHPLVQLCCRVPSSQMSGYCIQTFPFRIASIASVTKLFQQLCYCWKIVNVIHTEHLFHVACTKDGWLHELENLFLFERKLQVIAQDLGQYLAHFTS